MQIKRIVTFSQLVKIYELIKGEENIIDHELRGDINDIFFILLKEATLIDRNILKEKFDILIEVSGSSTKDDKIINARNTCSKKLIMKLIDIINS